MHKKPSNAAQTRFHLDQAQNAPLSQLGKMSWFWRYRVFALILLATA
jgi:hypothetical protein